MILVAALVFQNIIRLRLLKQVPYSWTPPNVSLFSLHIYGHTMVQNFQVERLLKDCSFGSISSLISSPSSCRFQINLLLMESVYLASFSNFVSREASKYFPLTANEGKSWRFVKTKKTIHVCAL